MGKNDVRRRWIRVWAGLRLKLKEGGVDATHQRRRRHAFGRAAEAKARYFSQLNFSSVEIYSIILIFLSSSM